MRMLDLFSGIGGFALAAEWTWGDDLDIVGFCEIDRYAQKVLNKNFPNVPIYKDITKLNGKEFEKIDLVTGGFPCQDISVANSRARGLDGQRSGLWFEMLRVISEVRPRYALIENVPMLTVRGGTRVISDLTEIGYDASWTIIQASDVGAWHKRARIWIVAYPQRMGRETWSEISKESKREKTSDKSYNRSEERLGTRSKKRDVPNAKYTRLSSSNGSRKKIKSSEQKGKESIRKSKGRSCISNVPNTDSRRFKKQREQESIQQEKQRKTEGIKPECRGGSKRQRSKPWGWSSEPELGRVAHGIPNRVDRLKGLGNAIVPQVAFEVFKNIRSLELEVEKG